MQAVCFVEAVVNIFDIAVCMHAHKVSKWHSYALQNAKFRCADGQPSLYVLFACGN